MSHALGRLNARLAAMGLASVMAMVACGGGSADTPPTGGGGDGGGGGGPVLKLVTITPDTFTVAAFATRQFAAAARDSTGAPFAASLTWFSTGGTVSNTGLFTAGATAGAASVWVRANNAVADTASGTITPVAQPTPVDTVFYDGFETETSTLSLWNDNGVPGAHAVVTDPAVAFAGNRALEITYLQGFDGGWLTRFFMPGWDTLYVSYYVKLQSGWLSGTKLISFYGSLISNQYSAAGKAGVCPDGLQFFVATVIAEANGNPGPTRFYTYYPGLTPDAQGFCYGSPGLPAAMYTTPTNLTTGVWHHIEFAVALNTPGQNNASQQFWVDGVLRGSWSGFAFRNTTDLRLNSVTITASLGVGAPQTQKMWVDDVLVLRRKPAP